MVILLTGAKEVGKSTVCRKVCDRARVLGYKPAGIICPTLHDLDKRKMGFIAENVATGRQWLLGTKERKLSGPTYGLYSFSRSGFRRALRSLKRAIKKECDLLVLDEVGPLEMEKGEGFRSALDWLSRQTHMNLLIVVRPSFIEEVKSLFEDRKITVMTADTENRDDLPEHILQHIR